MGDIGPNRREVEFEPLPDEAIPDPEYAPAPEKTPEPVKEPEKVPA